MSTSTSTTPSNETSTTITIHDAVLPLLTNDPKTWYLSSLLSVQQITSTGLQLLFQTAYRMQCQVQQHENDDDDHDDEDQGHNDNTTTVTTKIEEEGQEVLSLQKQNCIIGTIFYEPSTRTACSFQCAIMKLGGNYVHIDGGGNNTKTSNTSIQKGETLYDTIKCIQCYTNCIILRHYDTGCIHHIVQQYQKELQQQQVILSNNYNSNNIQQQRPKKKKIITKPFINAGDGIGEHPTQALLDVYTIYSELIRNQQRNPKQEVPSSLIVVVLGDLKHGRTVHSLIKLLSSNVTKNILYTHELIIRCCAPNDTLQLPNNIIVTTDCTTNDDTTTTTTRIEYYTDPMKACINANVLYVTRIQKERFMNDNDYQAIKGSYIINKEFIDTVTKMSNPNTSSIIVLHPLPRVDEISTDLDSDTQHALYFTQMEYGMYVRMAILYLILHKKNK